MPRIALAAPTGLAALAVVLAVTACDRGGQVQSLNTTEAIANLQGAPAEDAGRHRGPLQAQSLDEMLARTMNRFARLDLNGDGRLTQDELAKSGVGGLTGALFGRRGRIGGGAFQHADENGDGVVTRAEVEAETRERFDRLDTTRDGRVTPDEILSAFLHREGVGGIRARAAADPRK